MAADSAAPAAPTGTCIAVESEKKCDKCKRDDEESYILINKSLVENRHRTPIWRCKNCNNTGNIIWNLKENEPQMYEVLTAMTPYSKVQFMETAKGMVLDDVKKLLQESIEQKKVGSIHLERDEEPEAIAVSEAAKLPMFVSHPEGLQKLLDCPGMSFICGYTGIHMCYVPNYRKTYKESSTRENTHTQGAAATRTIAKPKGKAKAKAMAEKAPKVPKVKALPARVRNRAVNLMAEAAENLLSYQKILEVARSENGQQYVTPLIINKAEGAVSAVKSLSEALAPMVALNLLEQMDHVVNASDKLATAIEVMAEFYTLLTGPGSEGANATAQHRVCPRPSPPSPLPAEGGGMRG